MDGKAINLLMNLNKLSSEQVNLSGIIKRVLDEENVGSTEGSLPEDNSFIRFHKTSENGEVRISCHLASECHVLSSGSCILHKQCLPVAQKSACESQESCSTTAVHHGCSRCLKHSDGEPSMRGTSSVTSISTQGCSNCQKKSHLHEKGRSFFKFSKDEWDHARQTQNKSDDISPDPGKTVHVEPIDIGDIGVQEIKDIVKTLYVAAKDIFVEGPTGAEKEEFMKEQSRYLKLKSKEREHPVISQDIKADVLQVSIAYLEMKIIEIVKFAKHIPGFKDLSMDDQATLVRDSRTESALIGGMRLINLDNKVFSTNCGRHFTMEEMNSAYSKDFLEQKVQMSKRIVDLDMSEEEETLLRAITITFTDRSRLDNKVAVQNIQNKLITCLMYVIGQSGKHNPGVRLGQLFNVLVSLRDVTEVDMNEVKKILLETPAYTNSPVVHEFL